MSVRSIRRCSRSFLLFGLLALLSVTSNEVPAESADHAEKILSILTEQRNDKHPVVLVKVGETDDIEASLQGKNIEPDLIKPENNAAYYVTKFVHRLRRYGKLWILLDHREEELNQALRERFLEDYRVEQDQSFGHLSLIAVVNEFATDASPDNKVALNPIARVNHVVTDLTLMPNDHSMLITTKRGDVHYVDFQTGEEIEQRVLLKLDDALAEEGEIHQVGEAGLIGIALHPDFPTTPKLYLHYNLDRKNGERVARIAEWFFLDEGNGALEIDVASENIFLDIPQPASNHNGGDLAFGADGFLYIAIGDGEEGEWVKGRAGAASLRGKILRIDVDRSSNDLAYAIPPDNPFIGDDALPPETFAWGFRNPWRIAFAPDGRLIAGDVGEDVHEEITEVQPGRHHGWPAMEGDWCRLEAICDPGSSVSPLFQYGREAGMSVTGGDVYQGSEIPWLNGAYVFADFSSGWIWSLDLPDNNRLLRAEEITELGRWTIEFTAFAKAGNGDLYLGDLRGRIYRLAPLSDTSQKPDNTASEAKS